MEIESMSEKIKCENCNGTGVRMGSGLLLCCETCNGTGEVERTG